MFKVLLIDDEPIIREGLKTIIDWSQHGFEICGEAVNGRDGLAKVSQLQPDLLIVDIKMPVIDGLKLLEELRREGNRIQALILTGYSEFAYAQKAVNLGAIGYILKPIDEDDLSINVKKAYNEIIKERKVQKFDNTTITLATDRIIEALCWGYLDKNLLDRVYKIPALQFPWQSYRVCLIGRVEEDDQWDEVVNTVLNAYPGKVGYLFKSLGEIIFLLKDSAADLPEEILAKFSKAIQKQTGSSPLITAGDKVGEVEDLWISYWQAQKLSGQRFVKNSGILITSTGEIEETSAGPLPGLEKKLIEDLCLAIECQNKIMLKDLLASLEKKCLRQNIPSEKIKAGYLYLYFMVLDGLNLDEAEKEDCTGIDQETLNELYNCENLQELHQYIHHKLSLISDYLARTRPDGVIQRIIDYIQRNYNQDLKLGTLARYFNYNPAYLGKLFKSYTGEKFRTYLSRIRLQEAKQLLMKGEKVSETARKVGYEDLDYFNKKFREFYGIVPSAIKKVQDE